MASSVTHSQWPMSMEREAASDAQVCMTRARVYALWSLALSTNVSSRCCLERSLAAVPADANAIRMPQSSLKDSSSLE